MIQECHIQNHYPSKGRVIAWNPLTCQWYFASVCNKKESQTNQLKAPVIPYEDCLRPRRKNKYRPKKQFIFSLSEEDITSETKVVCPKISKRKKKSFKNKQKMTRLSGGSTPNTSRDLFSNSKDFDRKGSKDLDRKGSTDPNALKDALSSQGKSRDTQFARKGSRGSGREDHEDDENEKSQPTDASSRNKSLCNCKCQGVCMCLANAKKFREAFAEKVKYFKPSTTALVDVRSLSKRLCKESKNKLSSDETCSEHFNKTFEKSRKRKDQSSSHIKTESLCSKCRSSCESKYIPPLTKSLPMQYKCHSDSTQEKTKPIQDSMCSNATKSLPICAKTEFHGNTTQDDMNRTQATHACKMARSLPSSETRECYQESSKESKYKSQRSNISRTVSNYAAKETISEPNDENDRESRFQASVCTNLARNVQRSASKECHVEDKRVSKIRFQPSPCSKVAGISPDSVDRDSPITVKRECQLESILEIADRVHGAFSSTTKNSPKSTETGCHEESTEENNSNQIQTSSCPNVTRTSCESARNEMNEKYTKEIPNKCNSTIYPNITNECKVKATNKNECQLKASLCTNLLRNIQRTETKECFVPTHKMRKDRVHSSPCSKIADISRDYTGGEVNLESNKKSNHRPRTAPCYKTKKNHRSESNKCHEEISTDTLRSQTSVYSSISKLPTNYSRKESKFESNKAGKRNRSQNSPRCNSTRISSKSLGKECVVGSIRDRKGYVAKECSGKNTREAEKENSSHSSMDQLCVESTKDKYCAETSKESANEFHDSPCSDVPKTSRSSKREFRIKDFSPDSDKYFKPYRCPYS